MLLGLIYRKSIADAQRQQIATSCFGGGQIKDSSRAVLKAVDGSYCTLECHSIRNGDIKLQTKKLLGS